MLHITKKTSSYSKKLSDHVSLMFPLCYCWPTAFFSSELKKNIRKDCKEEEQTPLPACDALSSTCVFHHIRIRIVKPVDWGGGVYWVHVHPPRIRSRKKSGLVGKRTPRNVLELQSTCQILGYPVCYLVTWRSVCSSQ